MMGKLTLWMSKFVILDQYEAFIQYVYDVKSVQHHRQGLEVVYRDERTGQELIAIAYLNDEHLWDVYFTDLENEEILERLLAMGYEEDLDSDLYLFEAIHYVDAEENFMNGYKTCIYRLNFSTNKKSKYYLFLYLNDRIAVSIKRGDMFEKD